MAFQSSDTVLVTGANGHVAQHFVSQVLAIRDGPVVRACVRSASSASQIESTFTSAISDKRLFIAQVPDISAEGAFDDAIKGVTHIAHIASPLIIGAKDTENDLLIPAINGTKSILKTALREKSVRSVVMTSSFASVFDPKHDFRPGYTYTPEQWNPISYEEAADPNLDLNAWEDRWKPFITYMASKKLAEKAAWDLWSEGKPGWTFSTILPTYIGGPYVLPLKGPEGLTWSDGLIWASASDLKLPAPDFPYWVDVRDVAKAHIEALQRPEASGHRFILAASEAVYSDFAQICRQNFPSLSPSDEIQKVDHYKIDTSSNGILGLRDWISKDKMVKDTISQVLGTQAAS